MDGGMANNLAFLQFFADITGCQVSIDIPCCADATALGTAQLALLGAGKIQDAAELQCGQAMDCRVLEPREGSSEIAQAARTKFAQAVELSIAWGKV